MMFKKEILKINESISKHKIKIILIIIFILTIIYALINYTPYWDEAIYIGNGKYLFSGQEISTYEYQRPPLMGIVTGVFWFLGVNEIIFTKIILTIIFILGLFYLYKISEDVKKGSGLITTVIYASLPTIALFTNRILTEIPGTALSIIGYYFFTKKRYFLSGFILSLAFLFRYPTGLIFFVVGIFLLIEFLKLKKIKEIINYVVGFSLLVVPFIIVNYIFIGSKNITHPLLERIFLPFINASRMVAANAFDLVTNGYFYYLKFLLNEYFLLIFFIIFIIGIIVFKKIRKECIKNKIMIPLIISILSFIYVSNLVHYEPRYFIIGLPFFVIISGFTIITILEKIKIKHVLIIVEVILIIILIITYINFIKGQLLINEKTDFEKIANYYSFIQENDPDHSGTIAINNPDYSIYNQQHKIIYLSGTYYAYNIVTQNQPLKYILFEDKNRVCWRKDDFECSEKLNDFKEYLNKNYELIYQDYFNDSNHFIYRLK
jgi:4-amino-4-deoxy-L-arabinose transferase-like glycosyltransferase